MYLGARFPVGRMWVVKFVVHCLMTNRVAVQVTATFIDAIYRMGNVWSACSQAQELWPANWGRTQSWCFALLYLLPDSNTSTVVSSPSSSPLKYAWISPHLFSFRVQRPMSRYDTRKLHPVKRVTPSFIILPPLLLLISHNKLSIVWAMLLLPFL